MKDIVASLLTKMSKKAKDEAKPGEPSERCESFNHVSGALFFLLIVSKMS